jgi:2'-5' RNA ligase
MSESALVVLVPEAEAAVSAFRARYDPSAAAGMPAHVTLLYPFLPPEMIDQAVTAELTALFSTVPPFDYVLATVRRFPGVLYLAPEPSEPFRRVTDAIWQRFPDAPPYGGAHADIVPHLTVAHAGDADATARIEAEFAPTAERALPIRARAREAVLLDNRLVNWTVRARFRLGESPSD